MIGSMVAVFDGTHFDVVITRDAKSPFFILIQKSIVYIFIIIFAFLFARYGIEYAKVGAIQKSLMLRANLLWVYISVPIAGFVWIVFSVYRLYETFSEFQASRTNSESVAK